MIVYALWRFKRVEGVVDTIIELTVDEDVALHAMSSLRRAIGSSEALPHLERVSAEHPGTLLAVQANRQIRKIRRAAAAAQREPPRGGDPRATQTHENRWCLGDGRGLVPAFADLGSNTSATRLGEQRPGGAR